MTAWDDFRRANKGKGMSMEALSAAYQAQKASSGSRTPSTSSISASRSPTRASPPPPPAPVPARTSQATRREPTAWNQYQKEHSGRGLSQKQIADMYHAQKNATPASSAQSRAASAAPTTPSSRPNAWNQYLQQHAGQGLSRGELSSGYQAQKAAAAGSASQQAVNAASKRAAAAAAAEKRAASQQVKHSASSSAKSIAKAVPINTKANSWNEFLHQHAGQGLSKRQLSLLYKEQKNEAAVTSKSSSTATPTTAKPTRRPNAFNEFQKQYKKDHPNEKLTASKLAKIYREQQQQESQLARSAQYMAQVHQAEHGGYDNLDFGYGFDYGRDGGAQGYSLGQSRGYGDHGQSSVFNREAEGVTNMFDYLMDELTNDKRRQLEQLMLEIAQSQEQLRQQQASIEEREELVRVASELEAEEGNLNRKDFVNAHELQFAIAMSKENSAVHANKIATLRECEVIDVSRLQISMDDASRIGSGGSGIVYAGLLDGSMPVAVKVIDGVNTTAKRRFEQELLAMMRASVHENVLRVLGYVVFADSKSYGIVMELMAGGDLAFAMHRDESVRLSEMDLLRTLLQVIKAIEYIHSQGITHRDIKPHNILLSSDLRTAKLADFGLAGFKNATLSTRQSQVGSGSTAVGLTPAYAAPEVIDGKLSHRDTAWKKSDIFSFTVLLAEAVMHEQPWEFETPQFIMNSVAKLLKRPFDEEELSIFDDKVATSKLRVLVHDGWHQDPEVRPSATEMRKRLERIIALGESTGLTTMAKKSSNSSSPRAIDGESPHAYL